MALRVHNTLSRAEEAFVPIRRDGVRVFVCGPTVYDLAHVGHAKTYTQFDFIVRYRRFRDHGVTYAAASVPGLEAALADRARLRREGRYEQSDRIRDALGARGITVEDAGDGTRWYRERGPRS